MAYFCASCVSVDFSGAGAVAPASVRSPPSEFARGQSRSADRAPQPRTSRTASAIPIETLVRWHCRSAPRADCAHLERLDQ